MGGVDVTSVATIPTDHRSIATFGARQDGVVAGLPVVAAVIETVCGDTASEFHAIVPDGASVTAGNQDRRGDRSHPAAAHRGAHRTQPAVSPLGRRVVDAPLADALEGTPATVRDTRKTTPGLRALEKYAVRCGGGSNHRMGLSDMALVKDNHVAAAGGVTEAFRRVRELAATIPVEIEVDTLDGLREAIAAGADEVLIDNFTPDEMREAVAVRDEMNPAVRLEASGGLTLDSARAVAETGVDYIAVGELTHSARVLDIGLDLRAV